MNYRSISFRLSAWYAVVLGITLTSLCALAYVALYRYVKEDRSRQLANQANHIATTWLRQINVSGSDYVVDEIDEHLAPRITNRFVRITKSDGSILYCAGAPQDGSFDPAAVRATTGRMEGFRREYANGKGLLIFSLPVAAQGGGNYLIEIGEADAEIMGPLRSLLLVFAVVLPLFLVIAVGGGYLLTKRSLKPVEDLRLAAEHLTSSNLSERLPVPPTQDEIARLSTTLNRMIERLEGSFKRIAQFTADASHEIRTPLTILRGELEVALQRHDIGASERDVLESVLEEADTLSKTVENLLVLSRLDSGEIKLALIQIDLGKLCRETVDQMRLVADDRSVRISCVASGGVLVIADVLRIRQVIINLIDNAIKFTPAGGSVEVRVYRDSNESVVEVSDTGCGIPLDVAPLIFNRFYRVDDARTRSAGGLGLGLSIAKSISDLHRCRIAVDSELGKGTTVRVSFPDRTT